MQTDQSNWLAYLSLIIIVSHEILPASPAGSPASFPVVHLDKNIAGQMDAVEAQKKQPTAREIAAAKAARVRLGFENADPLDAMEVCLVQITGSASVHRRENQLWIDNFVINWRNSWN